MNKVFLFMLSLAVIGCAPLPRQPVDVALVPNDCANQVAITRWLDDVAQTPRSVFQSSQAYDNHVSQVKARLWTLRYTCNPVR